MPSLIAFSACWWGGSGMAGGSYAPPTQIWIYFNKKLKNLYER